MEFQSYPDAFRCPISLDLMSDPVILPSGQTFDRPSISRWLALGHRSCPVSNLPLPPHPPLIPNLALRHLISNYSPPPFSISHSSLISTITSSPDSDSLSQALDISKLDPAFRLLLSESGASCTLLNMISDPTFQELALRILLNISLDGADARVGLVAEGAVDRLADGLALSSPASAALCATLITSLAIVDANKLTIGAHPKVILNLTAMLGNGTQRERREAATALYELCKLQDNRRRAVRCGVVRALVMMARGGSERAVEVMGMLAKCKEGKEEMRRVDKMMGVMAGVLREGRGRGVENALVVIGLVCAGDMEMAREARREGVDGMCVLFVEDENEKIARNAAAVVRVLGKGR